MAGIGQATQLQERMQHIMGTVIARGTAMITSKDETPAQFMLVRLDNDQGIETIYDYGSDIRISNDIKIGDRVECDVQETLYHAMWKVIGRDTND